MIPIACYTPNGYDVKLLDHGGFPTKVSAPYNVGTKAFAIQDRTSGSARDGWLMFVGQQELKPEAALHRLALITLQEQVRHDDMGNFPKTVLGIAVPGYNFASYKILKAPELMEYSEEVFISHIQPILWIQPIGILHHFKPS
jgi:hypothetical protein